MLEPLGYRPRLANNFMAISIAYIMNIPLPKSGEISRGIIMDKYEGIPFEKGFGTIISERVVDLIFLLGFTLVAFLLQFDLLYAYITTIISPQKLILIGIAGVVLGVLFILFLKYPSIPGVGKKLQAKILSFLAGLKEGVFSIIKMKKKGAFLLHTCFIWSMYLLSFYTATHALEETSSIAMGAIITTFVVGSFAFAFSNSGFGFYPFFIAGILSLFAIPETIGTAFGWIVWTSNIASIVFFGALSFLILPFYNRNIKKTTSIS